MIVSQDTQINVSFMTEQEAMKPVGKVIWKGVVDVEDLLVQQLATSPANDICL